MPTAGIGTITVLAQAQGPQGPSNTDVLKFPGDGVYPTGGTPAFQASVRTKLGDNRTIMTVVPMLTGAYYLQYDIENDKLKAIVASTGVEVANGVDLSGTNFVVAVLSK